MIPSPLGDRAVKGWRGAAEPYPQPGEEVKSLDSELALTNAGEAALLLILSVGALEHRQTPLEIAGFDRPHKDIDDPGDGLAFAGSNGAIGKRGGDRLYRRRDVGRTLDRRKRECARQPARRDHVGRLVGRRCRDQAPLSTRR